MYVRVCVCVPIAMGMERSEGERKKEPAAAAAAAIIAINHLSSLSQKSIYIYFLTSPLLYEHTTSMAAQTARLEIGCRGRTCSTVSTSTSMWLPLQLGLLFVRKIMSLSKSYVLCLPAASAAKNSCMSTG